MNLLKQWRFGGVFGGVAQFSISTTTESKELVVRPSGFEPLAFCSGGKRSIQLSYGRALETKSFTEQLLLSLVQNHAKSSRLLIQHFDYPPAEAGACASFAFSNPGISVAKVRLLAGAARRVGEPYRRSSRGPLPDDHHEHTS
jgi:hypothetical protein